uniref:Uncharacterized protein n=1 Tax=Glossina morsitans morsitans TaxID=37546 RepID=A0A1B0G8F0_GLOMM
MYKENMLLTQVRLEAYGNANSTVYDCNLWLQFNNMQHSMVWYGMVWYGIVWYDMKSHLLATLFGCVFFLVIHISMQVYCAFVYRFYVYLTNLLFPFFVFIFVFGFAVTVVIINVVVVSFVAVRAYSFICLFSVWSPMMTITVQC